MQRAYTDTKSITTLAWVTDMSKYTMCNTTALLGCRGNLTRLNKKKLKIKNVSYFFFLHFCMHTISLSIKFKFLKSSYFTQTCKRCEMTMRTTT